MKQGVLDNSPNPEDEHAKLVDVTIKGRNLFEQMIEIHHQWSDSITADDHLKALHQAANVLRKLREKLGD